MNYEPSRRNHGLAFDPLKAIVSPRPIGWISTVDADGRLNLAPYSFFNLLSTGPALVGFSSFGLKDSAAYASGGGEFVCNFVSFEMREAMNETSRTHVRGTSEFEAAGLRAVASARVKPPRVEGVAAALECKLVETRELRSSSGEGINWWLVLGEVVSVYIDESYIVDGRFDISAARPVARCGYHDYVVGGDVFVMPSLP